MSSLRTLLPLALVALAACGGDDDAGTPPRPTFDPVDELTLPPADSSTFDVDWAPETVVASEADVVADIEDLDVTDGVYRVAAGSPLLSGVAEGTLVVWPTVGLFRVVRLTPEGDTVVVATEPGRLEDAATRADVSFTHGLTASEPGRAIGVALDLSDTGMSEGALRSELIGRAASPLMITDSGVTDSRMLGAYQVDSTLSVSGDTLTIDISVQLPGESPVILELRGTVRGLSSSGTYQLEPGVSPIVDLRFEGLEADLEVIAGAQAIEGSTELKIPVSLVFPFMVGPIPLYVSVASTFEASASLTAETAGLRSEARFSLAGSAAFTLAADGTIDASGELTRFSPAVDDNQVSGFLIMGGLGFLSDGPRVELGVGRPTLATLPLLGDLTSPVRCWASMKVEVVANMYTNPMNLGRCVTVNTNSGIFIGGDIGLFSWRTEAEVMVFGSTDQPYREGGICDEI